MSGTAPDNNENGRKRADPALAQQALKKLRDSLRGNGVDPSRVDLISFNGEVLDFEAVTHFSIQPKIGEKQVHGREKGEVVGSRADARAKIQAAVEKASHDPDVCEDAIRMLKEMRDLGFGAEKISIPLGRLKKVYVAHENCATCSGTGKSNCQPCLGKGKVNCTKCRGRREMPCPVCNGQKFQVTAQGKNPCIRCNARGLMDCDLCQMRGMIPCRTCKGTGQGSCTACNGTGWHSHMSYLDMSAQGGFDYDHSLLPRDAAAIIDSLKGGIVTERHGDVKINENRARAEELRKTMGKPNEFFVPYDVRLPWGDIEFSVGKNTLKGKIFGNNVSFAHMPPFLEKTAGLGVQALMRAAQGGGGLGAAMKYRMLSEALLASAQQGHRRALDTMLERYPFGVRTESMKKIIVWSDKALKQVTKKPRMIGLAIGLVCAAVLYGLYYLGPLRDALAAQVPSAAARGILDIALILLGGTVTTACIQMAAKKSLHKAIGRLLPPEKRRGLMPKAGQSALWGYLGGLGIYFVMIELAIYGGTDAPAWYVHLRTTVGL
ncbi:MAG: hypothetical protein HY370_03830 [Proteobacteria bacterium]|nr:hypothetical protein [Pseudomonadota bacterium]